MDDLVQRRNRLSVQPELLDAARPAIAELARRIDPNILDIEIDS